MDDVIESSESTKKWVIGGISFKSPLKEIHTKAVREEEECSTTPTSEESRISTRLCICPPAPKKRKPSSRRCNSGVGVCEFFHPPDLETVFKRRVEKA